MARLTRKQRAKRDAARFARAADAARSRAFTFIDLQFASLTLSLGAAAWARRMRENLGDG